MQLTVNQTTPILTWTSPATILYGTPLSATQLNAAAYQLNGTTPLDGTFVYSPAAGTVLYGRLEAAFRYLHPERHGELHLGNQELFRLPSRQRPSRSSLIATLGFTASEPGIPRRYYGCANGDTSPKASPALQALPLHPGQYPIIPAASGTNLSDYVLVVQNGTLTVTQAPVVITTTLNTPSIAFGLNVTMTANCLGHERFSDWNHQVPRQRQSYRNGRAL